jgi:anaerobic selenocysteine-containing dehydrogenase
MGEWQKTGCILCAQNCGLEMLVEEDRMVKVRPDKANPRSKGYACRKGLNILYHQYPADRLTRPLKRVGGEFLPISWEQALGEIAAKLQGLLDAHGPRCLAYLGGSAQGGHMEAGFGLTLLRALGSQYYYSSAGQEFSGAWWVNGRVLGKQYNLAIPDEEASEMLVAWGWNGMQSHQMPRAPLVLKAFSQDPQRLLISIDPRKSETAAIADLHLAVRPGTDALLLRAMIALILAEGWESKSYLAEKVADWERIRPRFDGFDVEGALAVCQLEVENVRRLCLLMTTRKWCLHNDLGIYMGRHSTLNSYLLFILMAVCGRVGVRGGNLIPGMVMPLGFHADERSEKVWRTVTTGLPPAAAGAFPPTALPEEIASDHPQRLRAALVSAVNPLRSWPDTQALEAAFGKLDLLVVSDIVMSETARLAHYVLPCRSFYESWDTTFFPWTYPEVYLQLRRPLVTPPAECLEASQIFTRLADRLGLIPALPGSLFDAASGDRLSYGAQLMTLAAEVPEAMKIAPFVLGKTLGEVWDSAAKAGLWGLLMTAPKVFGQQAARAGFAAGIDQGDRIFQALLDRPEGLWVGKADAENPIDGIQTPSGKIELFIPELEERLLDLTPRQEADALRLPESLPLVLNAGRHMKFNINTLMRNPEWNAGKRACTVAMSPADAGALNLQDGQSVKLTTAAGSAIGELEVSDQVRQGMVLVPHGFGLIYAGEVYGLNVNRLTKNTHRDPMGTPLHRFVPCRVEGVPG